MSAVQVIDANLSDAAHQQAILRLLDDYAREPIISGQRLPDSTRSTLIDGLRQHPTTHVLLAYRGSDPVGIAVCFLGFSTFAAKPLLNVHDVAVAGDFRGQGIGQMLLAAAESKARELDCCKVTLEVHEDNSAARKAYQTAGFEPRDEDSSARKSLFLFKTLS